MERRRLLEAALAAAVLPAAMSVIEQTSAHATALEIGFDTGKALDITQRELNNISRAHMTGASVDQSQRRALACWRDALTLKADANGGRLMRCIEAEARAAGLIAMFYGDKGDRKSALAWYDRAMAVTGDSDMKAWLMSCSVWVPLYEGNGAEAVERAGQAASFVNWHDYQQKAFAYNQMARGYALLGDKEHALEAVTGAQKAFNSYGYIGKDAPPTLSGFSRWQHHAYAADTLAILGESERSREHREQALSGSHGINGMNKVVAEVGEGLCLVSDGEPEAAVEGVQSTLKGLNREDRASAVVRGKAVQFLEAMPTHYRSARPVQDFREYLHAAA